MALAIFFLAFLLGYAAGIAQTRRHDERFFENLVKTFDAEILRSLQDKQRWLASLKKP